LTLGNLIKRIRTKIGNIGLDDVPFFHDQYVSAINDAIRSLRVQYIQNGLGNEFVESETFYVLIEDFDLPFLNFADLKKPILRSLPPSLTVRSSLIWKAPRLNRGTGTYAKGEKRIIGRELYEAVDNITEQDTYNNAAKIDRVRTFYPDNGLTFFEGDIVKSNGLYYVATQEYENNTDTLIEDTGSFEQIYWKYVGSGYVEARHVPFSELHSNRLKLPNSYPFSVKENKVWTQFNNVPFTLSYIPEWEEVTDVNEELSVPDSMLMDIQNLSVQHLIGALPEEPEDDQG